MTKPNGYIPKHCHHKGAGQGYVRLDGRLFYTGKWGSPASGVEYDRLIREFLRNGRTLPPQTDGETYLIEDLVSDFWSWFVECHPGPGAADPMKNALAPLLISYGSTEATSFDALDLLDLREGLIRKRLARKLINTRVTMLKRMFRWGVVRKVFPSDAHLQIAAIEGLKRGQSNAKESRKVEPVLSAHVDAISPYVSRQVAGMVRIQSLTGMRPGEVLIMRGKDIDRSTEPWRYEPSQHKNLHRGIHRVIPLGPQCREILTPYLSRPEESYLFSPREAEAERRAALRRERKSKVTPSQRKRQQRAARSPRSKVKDSYGIAAYRKAIARACRIAEVPEWSPNRLRHTAATRIRKLGGLDAAQALLGHKTANTTQIYAEVNHERIDRLMEELG